MTTTVQICSEPYITAIVGHDGTTDYEVTITLGHADIERYLRGVKGGMRHSDAFATDVLRATIQQGIQENLARHAEAYRAMYGEADAMEEESAEGSITCADALRWLEEQKRLWGQEV